MRISANRDPLAPTVKGNGRAAIRVASAVMAWTVWIGAGGVQAQAPPDPLVPDRPGLYCGSLTVPRGFLQIETGVAFERSREGPEEGDLFTTPIVIRTGLSERLELRVLTPGFSRQSLRGPGGDSSESAFGAASVGLKWRFADAGEDGARPSMAFLFTLGLPVGGDFARREKAEPSFLWAADFSLPAEFGLSTNAGVTSRYGADGGRFGEVFLAAALGRSITPASGLFVEVAGTRGGDGDSQAVIDGGVTHLLNDDVQLDFSVTRGLNRSTADWAVAGGVSVRFR